jgi:hypothetical protein
VVCPVSVRTRFADIVVNDFVVNGGVVNDLVDLVVVPFAGWAQLKPDHGTNPTFETLT